MTQMNQNSNHSLDMDNRTLVTLTIEELKKEELVTILATLIKNYASKK